MKRIRSVAGAGASIILTGLTNVLMPLAVQVIGGIHELGIFSLVTIPYTVALAIQRMVLAQSASRGVLPSHVPHLQRSLAALAAVATTVSICTACFVSDALWPILVACIVPIGLYQDVLRFIFIGQQRAGIAALSDLVWFVAVLAMLLLPLVHDFGDSALAAVSAGFLVGAFLAISVQFCALRFVRLSSRVVTTPSTKALFIESIAIFGSGQVTPYVAAAALSVAVVGEYRSVMLLMTPLTLAINLTQAVVFPRLDIYDKRQVLSLGLTLSCAVVLTGATFIVLGSCDPYGLLGMLGFVTGRSVVSVGVIVVASASISSFLSVYLLRYRVVYPTRTWLRTRTIGAMCDPIVSIPMSLAFGAPGIATGALASNAVASGIIGGAHYSRITSSRSSTGEPIGLEILGKRH